MLAAFVSATCQAHAFKHMAHGQSSPVPAIELANGRCMPQFGLGTYQLGQGEVSKFAMLEAMMTGYTHFDTSTTCHNQQCVGQAMGEHPVDRASIWISATLSPDECDAKRTTAAIDSMLSYIGVDYLDLVYMPQSARDIAGTWHCLEQAYRQGKVKALGISDFDYDRNIYCTLMAMDVPPQVAQIVMNPCLPDTDEWHQRLSRDHVVETYAYPLDANTELMRVLDDPLLRLIAAAHGKTPLQVMMRWHIQHGYVVVPYTDDIEDIKQMIDIFDFTLSPHEMETVTMIGASAHMSPVLEQVRKLLHGYQIF